jgi:hypothetical protein
MGGTVARKLGRAATAWYQRLSAGYFGSAAWPSGVLSSQNTFGARNRSANVS